MNPSLDDLKLVRDITIKLRLLEERSISHMSIGNMSRIREANRRIDAYTFVIADLSQRINKAPV